MSQIKLKVDGMSCGHCSARVQKALEGIDGVQSVTVDLDAGRADVEAGDAVSAKCLIETIVDLGFEAAEM